MWKIKVLTELPTELLLFSQGKPSQFPHSVICRVRWIAGIQCIYFAILYIGFSRVVYFQKSAQKSHLTMTGFSDPATNPNPSSGSRLNSTVLGSGTSFGSIGIHFRGSSQVVVLLRWLKILGQISDEHEHVQVRDEFGFFIKVR